MFALRLFLFSSSVCLAVGCGSDMPKTIQVTGKVTFDGSAPPGPGVLNFLPMESGEGFPLRPATGEFGVDGNYSAQTFEPNDGLMPGKYKIAVECWETPPNMDGKPVKSFAPKKFQSHDTSGLTLEVDKQSSRKEFNVDVTSK